MSASRCCSAARAVAWVMADRWYGQPDQPQGVGHLRGGGHVAEPGTGEGEGLAHGAGDDQPLPARQQGERAGRAVVGELVVRLVDDHDGLAGLAGLVDGLHHVQPQAGAGGVVGRAQEDDVGLELA